MAEIKEPYAGGKLDSAAANGTYATPAGQLTISDTPFETDKIEIVAYLKCHGKEPTGYKRQGGRVRFSFADRSACVELRTQYMLGRGTVVAIDFVNALEWARTAVHQS